MDKRRVEAIRRTDVSITSCGLGRPTTGCRINESGTYSGITPGIHSLELLSSTLARTKRHKASAMVPSTAKEILILASMKSWALNPSGKWVFKGCCSEEPGRKTQMDQSRLMTLGWGGRIGERGVLTPPSESVQWWEGFESLSRKTVDGDPRWGRAGQGAARTLGQSLKISGRILPGLSFVKPFL